jgi:hypothetical protein
VHARRVGDRVRGRGGSLTSTPGRCG